VDLGFLPAPVGIDVLTGMRLNEALLHAWDVRVAFDPAATIPGHLAAVLVEQLSGPVSFFLRFLGKPAAVDGLQFTLLVQTSDPALQFGLECTDRVSITDAPQDADDVIHMPTEAFVRLLSGRLTPDHTPVGIAVDSSRVSLDSLRAVFPGF
ncbi:MAG: maleylpyruvate isomerase family mycothiol-dependent enzyme, partial [Actinomycetota bacterium]|nr:maleylpyruvate isomerase family mycothiol-dependent enzyme [Actinomycetota bacterium]